MSNSATQVREWVFPDKDMTVAGLDDVAAVQADVDAVELAMNDKADLVAGKVPAAQLPSYVDDIEEYANFAALPVVGEAGKIYVTLDTNLTYRWSGSGYTEVSQSLALGETSATAYRGDRGKTAYDHSQLTSGNPHNVSKSDVGLGNVDNTSDANKPISNATQTALDDLATDIDFAMVQSFKSLHKY
jgi:hypothetical protein